MGLSGKGLHLKPSWHLAGQGTIGLLALLELGRSALVPGNVGADLLLVLEKELYDGKAVGILVAELGVAGGSQDFENTVVDGEEGEIEISCT